MEKRHSKLRYTEAILRTLGTRSELVNSNLARTYIPALAFESFGNLGDTMRPSSLMFLIDIAYRTHVWPIYDSSYTSHGAMMYSVGCRLDVDPSFYDIDTPKFPLVIDQSMVYVKNTSWRLQCILRHPDRKTPYAVKSDCWVNIDPKTRRPTPFPSWWKHSFDFPSDGPRLEYAIPERTSGCTAFSSRRVHFSDIDANGHVTYTAYVNYCYNAFAENALFGKYGQDVLYLLKNGVKSVQISFVNEGLLGDILSIESWLDASDEITIHFEVSKGGCLIVRLTFAFFGMESDRHRRVCGSKL